MNELDVLRSQAETQVKLIEQMSEVRNSLIGMDNRVSFLEKTIPLNRGEAFEIKNKVQSKSEELTSIYFGKPVSKELYGKKKIHLSQAVYYLLKHVFQAVSYTTILHVDFERAIEYIQSLSLDNLPSHYLRLTEHQYKVSLKNKDGLSEDFKGAYINRLKFVEFGT